MNLPSLTVSNLFLSKILEGPGRGNSELANGHRGETLNSRGLGG